ncbi:MULTISPECIES: hypothetical protein [unclassified Mesorhizobium]|uniref:hypothetical protein n=1 Tax=unclassified Mesorhizobium TaxID=325217 RepID=UPI0008007872|nr:MULTISPECIES: hypothetical protein [unclassified Mesorhizobium]TIV01620.1 MAG: hypothetical protein E5W04_15920 [Mesorhizobium sp.]OBQ82089.1 hypothetical protein A9K71_03615 [Mesorhizobium sp. WSM3873]PBB82468.1 hypothetical protein CK218_06415 [Mesorhizobium sp. WSM3879]PBB93421.1 hypothetical protein CK215_05545 [Mesorhizobium sp. WSM3864]RUW53671.1 hypothetical protein EOA32_08460 [Mesorhizobium sp. M1A.F.Ca.ET.072.01.1.1]
MRTPEPTGFSLKRLLFTPGVLCRAVLPLLFSLGAAQADPQKVWAAGAYSFSDELGGFRITGASGIGTKDDPLVITEELNSATPVTLTIRAIRPIEAFGRAGNVANGVMYMRIDVLNNSSLPWVEFQFELQEILDQPSVFGDGLSFDQRNKSPDNIVSSNFADFDRQFEPYDRLLFKNGKVDPLKTATFEFLITDYTPRWTFFLVQDPRIPTG